jgi:hypothetical protein
MVTNLNKFIGLKPGESRDVIFDTPVELEFERFFEDEPTKFLCTRMSGYYWDEDDHYSCDYYFYNETASNWICKENNLTGDSLNKVIEIINTKFNN